MSMRATLAVHIQCVSHFVKVKITLKYTHTMSSTVQYRSMPTVLDIPATPGTAMFAGTIH